MLLMCCCVCTRVFTQTSVTGIVIDKAAKKPIEFASISLLHLPDSLVMQGTATDKKGRYTFQNVPPGNYVLRGSFIGYHQIESAPFFIQQGGSQYRAATLELVADSKSLTNVTVTGTRAQLNTSIDRKVYNVEQDIMSRSGTASDILKNIPSVEVDVEGNVALRGSGDVMILINGKPNPLMGRTRADVLQQLPANSIERIEVITNPSARYRPDGTSGIINIVLKKNVRNGFNGTATVNAGNKDRYNGNLSLNYRPKAFNLFGSYSFRNDTRLRYNTIDRTYRDDVSGIPESFFNQTTNSIGHPRSNIVSGGMDYSINGKNSVGASGTYYHRKQIRSDLAVNRQFDKGNLLMQDFDRLRYTPELEKQINGTFYWQHNFAKDDNDLRVELYTSNEGEVENNEYRNIYRFPTSTTTRDNTLIKQRNKQNQLTADYTNELSDDSKLEVGYDGLFNRTDLNFYGEYFDAAQNLFVKDVVKSNRFIYNENMHAVYGTYQKSFKKFGYEIGVRAEGVLTKSHLVNLDSFVTNNYFKLYPTLHLSYKVSNNSELQLNYSKRVNRPEGDELNPFPEYQDPRNLRAGNPKLLPEIIHSTELGYKWQNKNFSFIPSVYYRYKKNGFTSVVIPLNDSTLLTTEQNLSNDQSAGLEVIFSAKAGSFFNASLSTNIFYNRINATNLGYIQNNSIYSGSATLTSSFTVTKTTMLQVSSNYRSARQTPQGKTFPAFVLNAGLRQDFLNNKLSATIAATDVFTSLRQKTELNLPNLNQLTVGRRDGFIFYVGLSYRFGVIKKAKEKMEFEEGM